MPLRDGGRVGGAADDPIAVHQTFPPNHTRSSDLVVGVVDTGFPECPHPWLADHIERSVGVPETIPPESMLGPDDGHGTFVAGRIVLEAPAVRVRMVRPDAWFDGEVSEAIRELQNCKLINLSLHGARPETAPPKFIPEALAALDPDTVVVISAGNTSGSTVVYPAGTKLPDGRAEIITVGAVDQTRIAQLGAPPPLAGFSTFGSWVDCYAEGVQLLGPHLYYEEVAAPGGARAPQTFRGWAVWSGTSFAAATVTGRIARVAMDLGMTPMEAWKLISGEARLIPVPNENPLFLPDWKPYIRGVTSTWGEITVPVGAPNS